MQIYFKSQPTALSHCAELARTQRDTTAQKGRKTTKTRAETKTKQVGRHATQTGAVYSVQCVPWVQQACVPQLNNNHFRISFLKRRNDNDNENENENKNKIGMRKSVGALRQRMFLGGRRTRRDSGSN